MGAIPLKAVFNCFPQVGGNRTLEAPGVVFDPTQGDEGVETHLPNDSFQASLSPPVGGRLCSCVDSGVFLRGLRIPSRFSPCNTHSREMVQTSGFDPTNQVKTCFDCKVFDVANWVACPMEKMVPEGCLHMRPFQFHLKEHWRFPQLLDTLLSHLGQKPFQHT